MSNTRNSNSILFISPDYHCSFFYRDELRRIGWKADIYVSDSYPRTFLYSSEDILTPKKLPTKRNNFISKYFDGYIQFVINFIYYLSIFYKYKYHIYYGTLSQFNLSIPRPHKSFRLSLFIAKLIGIKIIQIPTGCLENETKENFSKFDDGNVCNNCGWGDIVCNDTKNIANFNVGRRYLDIMFADGCYESTQFNQTHLKYKAVDLNIYSPEIEIPDEFKLPYTSNLRVLHSFATSGASRGLNDKNIKGSPYIESAVNRLKKEGLPIEFLYLDRIPSKHMRYYQAQADIVVEQLIYGWWGSTGVECLSLGKPVVCYLRPSWKKNFLNFFSEYSELPIVEANTGNIYSVLKKLVVNSSYRNAVGNDSREFAKAHFNVEINTHNLTKILQINSKNSL